MQPTNRQITFIALITIVGLSVLFHLKWFAGDRRTSLTLRSQNNFNKKFDVINKLTQPSKTDLPGSLKKNAPSGSTRPTSQLLRIVARSPTPLLSKNLKSSNWTLDSIRDLFFTEVLRVHLQCDSVKRVGRASDGGWDLCMDKGLKPQAPCLVYSFGVGSIWEFDEQLSASNGYNCTVRAFDPTMKKGEHIHTPGHVNFYPIGIGANDTSSSKFPVRNLLSFLRRFNERKSTLDVLKIDVEYSEWSALESIINDGLLGQIKQLVMEFHTNELNGNRSLVQHYRQYLTVMQKLEAAGFRKFLATRNDGAVSVYQSRLLPSERGQARQNGRSCCYEVYYINTAYRVV